MVKLASTLSRLNSAHILVIGDFILDTYTICKARGISPEAPIPVVRVKSEERRPGGAGNVILNLVSLGAKVKAIGRVGEEEASQFFLSSLKNEGVDTHHIFIEKEYKIPVKNRIIVDSQQIVRVDHEETPLSSKTLEQKIIETLPNSLKGIKIVAISDYGKGLLTPKILRALIDECRKMSIPVIVDPKGADFTKYRGAHLIKPNLSEFYAAVGAPAGAPLDDLAEKLLHAVDIQSLLITRSEAGISIFEKNQPRADFPAHIKDIKDVTGAGDTVLAMLTYSLANQLSYCESAQLCNIAAGIAIQQLGCARVSVTDLAHSLLEIDVSNKVFDENHLFVLQEVLKKQSYQVLAISGVQWMTEKLFRCIRDISQNGKGKLLIYLEDNSLNNSPPHFVEALTSLKEIDFIILHPQSLDLLLSKTKPTASYCFAVDQLVNTFASS